MARFVKKGGGEGSYLAEEHAAGGVDAQEAAQPVRGRGHLRDRQAMGQSKQTMDGQLMDWSIDSLVSTGGRHTHQLAVVAQHGKGPAVGGAADDVVLQSHLCSL